MCIILQLFCMAGEHRRGIPAQHLFPVIHALLPANKNCCYIHAEFIKLVVRLVSLRHGITDPAGQPTCHLSMACLGTRNMGIEGSDDMAAVL